LFQVNALHKGDNKDNNKFKFEVYFLKNQLQSYGCLRLLIQQYPALLLLIPPPTFWEKAKHGMFD
jgi:hypothetical protein